MRLVCRLFFLGLFPLLLLVAGCTFQSPIEITEKENLEPGKMKWWRTDGVTSVTKIKVNVKTESGIAFDAALIYEEHLDAARKALKSGQEPPTQLASRMGGEEFEATVNLEPGKPFVVIVRNPSTQDACPVKVEVRSGKAAK